VQPMFFPDKDVEEEELEEEDKETEEMIGERF
jgi:hypothetical protein